MPKPEPEILARASATTTQVEGSFVATGVMAGEGWEYIKVPAGGANVPPPPPRHPNGGDGGGDMTPLWRLDIPRDVQIAKWGVGALLTLIGMFFWLVYLPDTKEIRRDIGGLNTNVAVQTKAISGIERSLEKIEARLEAPAPPPVADKKAAK